jgi:hypothetical protein
LSSPPTTTCKLSDRRRAADGEIEGCSELRANSELSLNVPSAESGSKSNHPAFHGWRFKSDRGSVRTLANLMKDTFLEELIEVKSWIKDEFVVAAWADP